MFTPRTPTSNERLLLFFPSMFSTSIVSGTHHIGSLQVFSLFLVFSSPGAAILWRWWRAGHVLLSPIGFPRLTHWPADTQRKKDIKETAAQHMEHGGDTTTCTGRPWQSGHDLMRAKGEHKMRFYPLGSKKVLQVGVNKVWKKWTAIRFTGLYI